VKFLRQTDKVTKVIDELGSDASLYLSAGADYSGIIAFVWDDSRRNEEHSLLQDGLRQIRGVLGAVRSGWDHEFESPLLQQAVCLSGERRGYTGKAPHLAPFCGRLGT
jgi:hypothetical protein